MIRLFVASFVGLTVVAAISTGASAHQCVARSVNGAAGWGSGITYERAQKFALRHCRPAGGDACHIIYCK